MLLPETSVGAAVGMTSTSVQAVIVGAVMALAAVSGSWLGSGGGGFDTGGGGLEGGPEGSPEPVFRRFS